MSDDIALPQPIFPPDSRPIDVYVGQRLMLARERSGKSVGEFASALGVSPVTLRQYEAGSLAFTSNTICSVASALEVSLGFLYGFTA